MNSEIWKPIPGYEGYYSVSSAGRVRSESRVITRVDGIKHPVRERILKTTPDTSGYPLVVLQREGVQRTKTVHSLVALAFLGTPPPGNHVRHKDGSRDNNCLENLEYGTHGENMLDSVAHGTHIHARKESCNRGHLYVEGNMLSGPLKRGLRVCRSCINARARIKKKGWDMAKWGDLADKYYAEYTGKHDGGTVGARRKLALEP